MGCSEPLHKWHRNPCDCGFGSTEASMNFVGSKVHLHITSKQSDKGHSKTVGGFETWSETWSTKQKQKNFVQDFQSLIPSLDKFYPASRGKRSRELYAHELWISRELVCGLWRWARPKGYHVLNRFFLPIPGFLEFIWIFSSKNQLNINISHILNPNLTK